MSTNKVNTLLAAIAAAEFEYKSAKAAVECLIDGGLSGYTQEEFDEQHEALGAEEGEAFNKLEALKYQLSQSV